MIWWIAGAALLWVIGAVATYGHAYNAPGSPEREYMIEYKSKGHNTFDYVLDVALCYSFMWPRIELCLLRRNAGE